MRLARRGFAFAALAALVLVSACGDDDNDNDNGGTAQDLSGTYSVTTFEQQVGGAYVEIPGVNGTFVLTSTQYTASIFDLPVVGTVNDVGTYTAIGTATSGEFTQNSTLPGGTQAQGTYAYNASTGVLVLTTVVNTVGQRITVQRQGV